MSRRYRAASSAMAAAALVVSIIIMISIATYATVVSNGNESSYVSCTETTSTIAVLQGLAVVIPSEPCAHKISLSVFSLTAAGSGTPNSNTLRGTISVDSQSPLIGLILYLNGTYELYSGAANSNTTNYTIHYGAVLTSIAEPIVAGNAYSVEFIALFQDGTATIASTQVSAAG